MNELPWIDESLFPLENGWYETEDLLFIKKIYSITYDRIKLYIDSGNLFCLKEIYKDFMIFHYDQTYTLIIEESIKNLIVNTIRYIVKNKDTINYKYKNYESFYKDKYLHELYLPNSLNELIIFNFTDEYHHKFILNEILNLLKNEDFNLNLIDLIGGLDGSQINYFTHLLRSIKNPILLNSIKDIIQNISNISYEKDKSIDNILSNSKHFISLPDCFYLPYCDDLINELINTKSNTISSSIILILNSMRFNPNNYFNKLKNTPFKYSFYHPEATVFINEFYSESEPFIKDYVYYNLKSFESFNKFKLNYFKVNSNYEFIFRQRTNLFIKDFEESNDRIKDLLE